MTKGQPMNNDGTIAYFPRVDAGHHWDDKDEEF